MSSTSSIVHISLGLNKCPFVSPLCSPFKVYSILHGWAHLPLFPLLPPIIELIKHCPEYATQIAPWTNISVSIPKSLDIYFISSNVISRDNTILWNPLSLKYTAASPLCIVIWVDACTSINGNSSLILFNKPKSWIIKASTPISYRYPTYLTASSISFSFKIVFNVTYIFTS